MPDSSMRLPAAANRQCTACSLKGQELALGLGHRYRLDHLLSHSTWGDIWQATWQQTGAVVVVKVPRQGLEPQAQALHRDSLRREGDFLRRLSHPYIVRLQCSGQWQGEPVVVLEKMHQSLKDYLGQLALDTRPAQLPQLATVPAAQALAWARQVAMALRSLHRSGRKHLDLKPANLLLSAPDASGRQSMRLADFGACLPLTHELHSFIGTPGWAAPEQIRPVGADSRGLPMFATSAASDWYALGQLLHRLLTGRLNAEGRQALLQWRTAGAQATWPIESALTPAPALLDDAPTWLASDPDAMRVRHAGVHPATGASRAQAPTSLPEQLGLAEKAPDAAAALELALALCCADPSQRLAAARQLLGED